MIANADTFGNAVGNGKNVAFISRDWSSLSLSDQMHFVKVRALNETVVQPLPPLFDVGPDAYLPPLVLGAIEPAIGRPRSEQRACTLMFFMDLQTAQPPVPLQRCLAAFQTR